MLNHTRSHTLAVLLALLHTPYLLAEQDSFDHLSVVIETEIRNKELPLLSIVLVDQDGVVWSRGFGKSAEKQDVVADESTVYRIGSVSKLFTDIALMQYVEEGILDLDEPIENYLPEFQPANPYDEPITLRMLTSHASGLVRESPVGNYFDPSEPSLEETVLSLNRTRLVYEPGTKVQYSNAGIAVVGRILEQVSGKPFDELLTTRILDPLGMHNSAFVPRDDLVERLPEAYMWNYQGDRTIAPTFELGTPPAGSMYSDMTDLALFMSALTNRGAGVNGRILQESTLDRMWSPQTDIRSEGVRNHSFGIGFILGDLNGEFSVSHGGAIYGFASQLKVLPIRKLGVAVATNLDMANGAINRIADYALEFLMARQEGKPVPEFVGSGPVSEERRQQLVGRYSGSSGVLEIKDRFGDLYIDRFKGLSLRLRESRDRVIVDDLLMFSEDFAYSDQQITLLGNRFQRVENSKPAPSNDAWKNLIGEYGFDHNPLIISEKFGTLHALIEWGMEYSLTEQSDKTFRFPPYGLYPNETLRFDEDANGNVINASLNGVNFTRRSLGTSGRVYSSAAPPIPVKELENQSLRSSPPLETGEFKEPSLVPITSIAPGIKLDMRYSTSNNEFGMPVYSTAGAYLQKPAAEALVRVSTALEKSGFGLLVHDAYRPWHVTKMLWGATPEEGRRWLANPADGSPHNRGCAVDLTLFDLVSGEPVEMVGPFGEISPRSGPHYPGGTSLQRWHRDQLRLAMSTEGFHVHARAWWHYDFQGCQDYRIENVRLESIER